MVVVGVAKPRLRNITASLYERDEVCNLKAWASNESRDSTLPFFSPFITLCSIRYSIFLILPHREFAVQVGEQCAELLDCLDDDLLRQVAIANLEGYTNNEIAEQQGTSRRTVERQLGLIRRIWNQERKP